MSFVNFDSPKFKVSSVLGDVFILMCTVSLVKSKHLHGKVNSSVFVVF